MAEGEYSGNESLSFVDLTIDVSELQLLKCTNSILFFY